MSGYYFSLTEDDPPISWKSKKRSMVTLSTCEAEYRSLAKVTQESLHLTQLLNEIDPVNLENMPL